MAKNEKFKIGDDYGFGSSLDLPNFGGIKAPKIKNDRSPVTHLAVGIGKGIKDSVISQGFIRNVIKNALPQGYGTAIDLADKTAGGIKNLYNDTARDVRPVLNDLKRATNKLITSADTAIPKNIGDKIKLWTKAENSSAYKAMTPDEQRDAAMRIQLGEIFQFQTKDQLQRDAKQHAKDSIRSGIEQSRHRDQIGQLAAMRISLQQIANYQNKVDSAFQRKSLELQFRHYFVAVDSLTEMKRANADAITQLQLITKNTSLPDFVKLKTSERLREVMRNDFVGGINDSVFAKRREFFKNIGDAIVSTTKSRLSGLLGNIKTGLSSADMMSGFDFDDGTHKAERHGRMGASIIGDLAAPGVGGWVGKKIKGHLEKHPKTRELYQKISKTGKKLHYGITNAQQEVNERMNNYDRSKNGAAKNFAFDFLNDIRKTANATNTHLIKDNLTSLQEPIPFTKGVAKSINEIIPGYLSLMLRELQIARTGNANTQATSYDHTTNRFVSRSTLSKNLFSSIIKQSSVKDVKSSVNALINKVEHSSGRKLTVEQRRLLGNQMLEDNLKHNLPGQRLARTTAYRGDAKKHAGVYASMFEKHLADPARRDSYIEDFNNLGQQIHDPRELIQHYQNLGYGDELDRMGFVQGNSGLIDITNIKSADRKKLETMHLITKGQNHIDSSVINIGNSDILRKMGIVEPSGSTINMNKVYGYHFGDDHDSGTPGKGGRRGGRGGKGPRIPFGPRKPRGSGSGMPQEPIHQTQHTQDHRTAILQQTAPFSSQRSNRFSGLNKSFALHLHKAGGAAKGLYESMLGKLPGIKTKAEEYKTRFAGDDAKTHLHHAHTVAKSAVETAFGVMKDMHANVSDKMPGFKAHAKEKAKATVEATKQAVDELSKHQMFGKKLSSVGLSEDPHTHSGSTLVEMSKTLLRIEKKLNEGIAMHGGGPGTSGQQGKHWWDRSFLGTIGSATSGAFGIAKKGASLINNAIGGGISNAFGLVKGGLGVAGSLKNKMMALRDVYVKGDPPGKPRLESWKLRAGYYTDEKTKKPVKAFKDITGNLLDEHGDIVLHDYEISRAYLKGKMGAKLISGLGAGIRGLKSIGDSIFGGYVSVVKLGFKASKWVVTKAFGLTKQAQDVYSRDDLQTPKLTARTMRSGGYRSTVTGKIIHHPGDIDGAVDVMRNGQWEQAMSSQDVASGVLDRNGKPIKTGFSKLFSIATGGIRTAFKVAKAVGSTINKAVTRAWDGTKYVAGFAKDTALHGVMGWGQRGGMSSSKKGDDQGIKLLTEIRDLLKTRLPQSKRVRVGSFEDEVSKGLVHGDPASDANMKVGKDGIDGNAGKGGVLGMLGGLFGGKGKGGGDGGDHEDHTVKDMVEGEVIERVGEKALGKFGKAFKWGKGLAKSGGSLAMKGLGKVGKLSGVAKLLGMLGLGAGGSAMAGGLKSAASGGEDYVSLMSNGSKVASTAAKTAEAGGLAAKGAGLFSAAKGLGGAALKKAGPLGAALDVFFGINDLLHGKKQENMPSGWDMLSPMRWGMYAGNKINNGIDKVVGGSLGSGIYNATHHNQDPTTAVDPAKIAKARENIARAKANASGIPAVLPPTVRAPRSVHAGDLADLPLPNQVRTTGPEPTFDTARMSPEDLETFNKMSPAGKLKYFGQYLVPTKTTQPAITPPPVIVKPTISGIPNAPVQTGAVLGTGTSSNIPGVSAAAFAAFTSKMSVADLTAFGKLTAEQKLVAFKKSGIAADMKGGPVGKVGAPSAPKKEGFWSNVGDSIVSGAKSAYGGAVNATSNAMTNVANADYSVKGISAMATHGVMGVKDAYNSAVSATTSGIENTVKGVKTAANVIKGAYSSAVDKTADMMMAAAGAPKKAAEAARATYNKAIAVASDGMLAVATGPSIVGKAYNTAVDKTADAMLTASGVPAKAAKAARDEYNKAIASAGSAYGFTVSTLKAGYNAVVGATSDAMMSTDKAITGIAKDAVAGSKEAQTGIRGNDGNLVNKPKTAIASTGKTPPPPLVKPTSSGIPGSPDAAMASGSKSTGIGKASYDVAKGTGGHIDAIPQPSGRGTWAGVKDTILAAAKMVGVDGAMLGTIAAIESGFDYLAKASTSTATGLYQFVSGTWRTMIGKYGSKYGIVSGTAPTDARANALMGAEFMKENADALKGVVNRPLTDTDLYLAHFLGAGGAKTFLKADPNAIAADIMPGPAGANKSIFYSPDGSARTFAAVYSEINRRVQSKGKQFGLNSGNPNPLTATGPVVAKTDKVTSSGIPSDTSAKTPPQAPVVTATPPVMGDTKGGYAGSVQSVREPSQASSGVPSAPGVAATTAKGFPASTPIVASVPPPVGSTVGFTGAGAGNVPWDVMAAVSCLNNNAGAQSQGRCAEFVRKAVEAGGVMLNRTNSAKDYGSSLQAVGFQAVTGGTPQAGDVAIIQPVQGHPHGHMTMFNGTAWISDFVQHNGYYPGEAYRRLKPPVTFYRHSGAAKSGAKQLTPPGQPAPSPTAEVTAAATETKGLDGSPADTSPGATGSVASSSSAPIIAAGGPSDGRATGGKSGLHGGDLGIPVSNVTPSIVSSSNTGIRDNGEPMSPATRVLNDKGEFNKQTLGGFMPLKSRDIMAQAQYQREDSSKGMGALGTTLEKSYGVQKDMLDVLTSISKAIAGKMAEKGSTGQQTQEEPPTGNPPPIINRNPKNMSRPPVSMAKHGNWQ